MKNIGSEIEIGGNLMMKAGDDINVLGSDMSAKGDMELVAGNEVNITNAIDSSYRESSSSKKGLTKQSQSHSIDYVETALASNLSANNINISSGGDTAIIGSNLDSKGNLIIGSFIIAQNQDGTYKRQFGIRN